VSSIRHALKFDTTRSRPRGIRHRMASVVLGCALVLIGAVVAHAQEEYTLGPEDVISVTVWESPELSRTVVVRADGTITLPPLGDVPAAGRATSVLARDLEREFYDVLRRTLQVTVSVIQFNSRKVYLAGQVTAPGRYSFERIPNLVDLLGQAGGLGANADLSEIRVVRREGDTQRTLTVDLTRAVQSGDLSSVPPLQPDDVVIVPTSGGGIAAGGVAGEPIYVMGLVGTPGAVPGGGGINLMQALSLAGGVAPDADLTKVEVVANDPAGSYLMRIDLESEIRSGSGGPILRPGDAIRVVDKHGFAQVALGAARLTLDASRDLLNILAIREVLRDN
jgi:polysaccharide biosynthesis/export protein